MLPSIQSLASNFTSSSRKFPFVSAPRRSSSKSHVCFAFSLSDPNPVGEESRWLREEHRWLREEHRWLREEQRWKAERQALLQEISSLKLRVEELETLNSFQGSSVPQTAAAIAKLLQALKEGELGKNVSRLAETGTSALPLVVEAAAESKEVVIEELISVPKVSGTRKKREALQRGSEGDDVRAMQEALQRLGFYSGEEDMEYSSFSSGTERAVKTWQATLGEPENGVMTADLLNRLFTGLGSEAKTNRVGNAADSNKMTNGAPVAAFKDLSQVHHTTATEEGITDSDLSRPRVFLLGENRWEEPSRLNQGSKDSVDKKTSRNAATQCTSCRGEGRVLCMECDGTGEPNIEPQFLEWVGEGAKCAYCDGLGYMVCDACDGRK